MDNNASSWLEKDIDLISQKLALETLRTISSDVIHSKITLFADGIKLPHKPIFRDITNYLEKCIENSIIPYSLLTLKFNDKSRVFVPNSSLNRELLTQVNSPTINGLLNGGRFSEIIFEEGFEYFVNFQLPFLEKVGYVLDNFDLVSRYGEKETSSEIIDKKFKLPQNIEYCTSEVKFCYSRLNIEIKEDNLSADKFRYWFDNLFDFYQIGQMKLNLS